VPGRSNEEKIGPNSFGNTSGLPKQEFIPGERGASALSPHQLGADANKKRERKGLGAGMEEGDPSPVKIKERGPRTEAIIGKSESGSGVWDEGSRSE